MKAKKQVSARKLAPNLSGAAGQYFVAAELSRRGVIASITLRNARGIDILASNDSGTHTVRIQVKTKQDGAKAWIMHEKYEDMMGIDLFYVFVNLNGADGIPEYHVVESNTVAKDIKKNHQVWLSSFKKDGSPRKNTSMRIFHDIEGKYRSAWERLGLWN